MDKNSHISLVLSSFRQYLSLTQAQFANDVNTKLGYNKSDKEFLTQSSVNRIEKGNAISDKRTYDFLLNKFFFSNLDKCSNCAQLAKFIVEELYISDINIDNIFEFVDNLIIVSDTIINGNKYDVFPCDIINNPITLTLRDKILENKNIDIGKVDSVNELIKAIYREIR